MLKGKTTIQLFDAKTGELTDEVTKTNLVTNAVRNALGGAFNQLASGNAWSKGIENINKLYTLPEGKNFAQTMYGGVLVFSKPIIEDVDHCLPTIDEIKSFIGSANQSASDGSDSFRGSLNAGESEMGTNYVKFVWDFKTNECNGDIASICLTSDCGGAVGYGFDVKKPAYIGKSLRGFGSYDYNVSSLWDVSANYGISYKGCLTNYYATKKSHINGKVSYIDGDYFYTIGESGIARKINISRIISKDNFGLSIIDGFNYGSSNLSLCESIDTGIPYIYAINQTSKNCAYAEESGSSNSEYKLIKYYGDGLAERITIPISNINSAIAAYYNTSIQEANLDRLTKSIYKDKLYCATGQFNMPNPEENPNKLRIWVLNFDGTYTYKDVALTDKMVTLISGTTKVDGYSSYEIVCRAFGEYRGSLYFEAPERNDGFACFLVDDDGTMQTHPFMINDDEYSRNFLPFSFVDNTDIIPNPYIVISKYSYSDYDDDNRSIYLNIPLLVSAYLGTINNQGTVLTKTPDKTMKIIYTLTQA